MISHVQGPSRPAEGLLEAEERRETERERVKRGRKELRKHHDMVGNLTHFGNRTVTMTFDF